MICNLGSRVVNNYLISSDLGYILIDTGYDGSFPRFLKMLGKNGVDPKEIKFVFLTHAHDDHAGFLNEVLSATDAQVILHPKAVAGLKRGQNSFEGGCSSYPAWLFCQILALFGHGEHRYPPIRDAFLDRLIPIDSERFRSLGFPYEILETPGHTADHISLLVGDKLFCGDAAMNGFPSRRGRSSGSKTCGSISSPGMRSCRKRPPCSTPATASPSRPRISGNTAAASSGSSCTR